MNQNRLSQILLLTVPLIFFWHLEVVIATLDLTVAEMENGWLTLTGGQVYHLGMYLLYASCFYGAVRIEYLMPTQNDHE